MPTIVTANNFTLRETATFKRAFNWFSDHLFTSGILILDVSVDDGAFFNQAPILVNRYFDAMGGVLTPSQPLMEGRHLLVYEDYGPFRIQAKIVSQTFPVTLKLYEYLNNGDPVTMTAEEVRNLLASLVGDERLGVNSINLSGLTIGWTGITGKPSAFTPSTHQHEWNDILNPPDPGGGAVSWEAVTGKPSAFTPSTHEHPWSAITDIPDLTSYVTIPSVSWDSITGKPSTFTPATHSHDWADVTNKPDFGGSSGSGALLEFTRVNASTSLSKSGCYFTDDIAANIGATFTSPPLGLYLRWINRDNNKSVILVGFASVNGTAIPSTKGIAVAGQSSIELFVDNDTGNARVLSGSYTVNFSPGNEPPVVTFTRVSAGDTNGLVYYLGTDGLTTSFVNPAATGKITATADNWLDIRNPTKAFDRANDGNSTIWHNNGTTASWMQFKLENGRSFMPTGFELWASDQHNFNLGSTAKFQGSNDGTTWEDIVTFVSPDGVGSRYFNNSFLTATFYVWFRFKSSQVGYSGIGDIELYGELQI